LLVGPEGGWIEAERQRFGEAGWVAGSLGPSILRAETAVCAALGVLAQMWLMTEERENPPGTIE
jgi:16S rRNA (uracil1498-N3)-methyltransferase